MGNIPIPIIDLFAGPGGLGEGFMSIINENKERAFKIALSIEKDPFAHQTLTLRSFLRQFPFNNLPNEYYQFLEGKLSLEELYNLYPKEAKEANNEAWQFTLGDSNHHEFIDKRIRKALDGKKDFVLIGGPPCQAYSLVGRSRRQEAEGLNIEDERVFLYREYYRILAVHRPAVFIMENVKGLLSSKVENEFIFNQIISDLENPIQAYKNLKGQERIYKSRIGYRIYSLVKPPSHYSDLFSLKTGYKPTDFIIHSERYGIPQTRHRVILLGIRSDLNVNPEYLKHHNKPIAIDDVISDLPLLRSGLSKTQDTNENWKRELKKILESDIKDQINSEVWDRMKKVVEKISVPENGRGGIYLKHKVTTKYKKKWYSDKELKGVLNHETRSHITEDLFRYLFVSCFAKEYKRSPKLSEFPPLLMPKHKNASTDKFADRFRVQILEEPSKTVTSHISKDGHYFIHPDPNQCRSLTVREAARIQTFPDNYFFCGPRTQQFHQVGNAVPPLLAKQIAEIVSELFK